MMLDKKNPQDNPHEEIDIDLAELKRKAANVAKVLDENAKQIHRWFWKSLFALNTLFATWYLWMVLLPSLLD